MQLLFVVLRRQYRVMSARDQKGYTKDSTGQIYKNGLFRSLQRHRESFVLRVKKTVPGAELGQESYYYMQSAIL